MSKFKGATLAVGTEVTDGQITDRNSAWLSQKMVEAGVEVIEHRAVPDDRKMIADALNELSDKVDFLFVTGGLGPTSDDFTRDLLAEVFERELVYDEPSWQRIEERFAARGQKARPIQKQQCYFPRGSKVLINEAGTANAFQLEVERQGRKVQVYAMPGPPAEIAVVWKAHLEDPFSKLVSEADREELFMIRTIGRGEGDLAEKTEEVIKEGIQGGKLRVGYRATVPFVEIKFWYKKSDHSKVLPYIQAVEKMAGSSIVARGDEDLADSVLDLVAKGRSILIRDSSSRGFMAERLFERYRSRFKVKPSGSLNFISSFDHQPPQMSVQPDLEIALTDKPEPSEGWVLKLKNKQGSERELEVGPNPIYKPGTDRGFRFITEMAFHLIRTTDL